MIKNYLRLFVFMVIGLMLTACGESDEVTGTTETPEDGETTVLKLGHIADRSDAWHIGAEKFAELVEEKTEGSVEVEIYPSSSLGNDRDLIEGMQLGSVDFALVAGVLSNFYEPYSILELPYLFNDFDHLESVLYGEIGEQLQADLLENTGLRGLEFWVRGPRVLTTNKQIESAEDLNSLKIRVPEIPASIEAWEAMGATPTPMAFGEVYSSLQTGVIDAQENPLSLIASNKFSEVQDYLVLTNHVYGYVQLTMSDDTYQKLSEEQQKAIEEAAREATEFENELVFEQEEQLLEELNEAGMQVIEPDVDSFSEKARTVHDKFADEAGRELYDSIMDAQ